MQKVILIGDGGYSKVIEDCILASGDIVLAKLDERHRERFMDGDVVKGPIAILPDLFAMDVKICVAIEQNEARGIVDLLNIPLKCMRQCTSVCYDESECSVRFQDCCYARCCDKYMQNWRHVCNFK